MKPSSIRALTELVNLPDGYDAWQRFDRHWPEFLTKQFAESVKAWARGSKFDRHILHGYKSWLRAVWEGQDLRGVRLGVLLGIYVPWPNAKPGEVPLPTGDASFDEEVKRFIMPIDYAQYSTEEFPLVWFPFTYVALNWRMGRTEYRPACDFQEALYWLFRNSWRAKICPQCGTYFVARRPPQRFCSTDCRDIVNRRAKLEYWHKVGKARRRARTKTSKNKARMNP